MKGLFTRKRSPIGLDLGARQMKAVQLEPLPAEAAKPGPRWRVAAAVSMARTGDGAQLAPAEVEQLCGALDRLGFVGNDVVVAVPPEKLLTSVLELPPRNGQVPVDQIARVELARSHKCAPDAFEMSCWDLPAPARANKATHVMAVACTHADANALLDGLEAGGLNVCGLQTQAAALAHVCEPLLAQPPGISALLDLGWSAATLVLLHEGKIIYGRALAEAGLKRLFGALSERLRLDPEVADYLLSEAGLAPLKEELPEDAPPMPAEARAFLTAHADATVQELLVSFGYVAHQYGNAGVSRLLLVGGGASIPGLAEHFGKALAVEARTVALADLAECPPGLLQACGSPALTLAGGLAQLPDF